MFGDPTTDELRGYETVPDDTPDHGNYELEPWHPVPIERPHREAVEIWNDLQSAGEFRLDDGTTVRLAHPIARFIAILLDYKRLWIVAVAGIVILGIVALLQSNSPTLYTILILWFIFSCIYETMTVAGDGRTKGRTNVNIAVIRADNGESPSHKTAAKRSLITVFHKIIIGALVIVLIATQQGSLDGAIHAMRDSVVGTIILFVGVVSLPLVLNAVGWVVQALLPYFLYRSVRGWNDRFADTVVINIGSGTVSIDRTDKD